MNICLYLYVYTTIAVAGLTAASCIQPIVLMFSLLLASVFAPLSAGNRVLNNLLLHLPIMFVCIYPKITVYLHLSVCITHIVFHYFMGGFRTGD